MGLVKQPFLVGIRGLWAIPPSSFCWVFLGFPGCRSGVFLWGLSLHRYVCNMRLDHLLPKEEYERFESFVESSLDVLAHMSEGATDPAPVEVQENNCADGSSSACPLVLLLLRAVARRVLATIVDLNKQKSLFLCNFFLI